MATTASNPINLPKHKYNGKDVPTAYPSLAVAKNNLSLGREDNVFLTYQAFENGQWNVYLRHIIFSTFNESPPRYVGTYEFTKPGFSSHDLLSLYSSATYTIKQVFTSGNRIIALAEMSVSEDSDRIYTGLTGNGSTTYGFVYDRSKAYVEMAFDLTSTECGNLGSVSLNWFVGNVYYGSLPPTANQLGWAGLEDCVTITTYPVTVQQLTIRRSSCSQTLLFDDPYCYAPYVALTYHPEDMYTLKIDDQIVTRVLYHLSTKSIDSTSVTSNTIDIMFVIDHSGSMSQEISTLRSSLSVLSRELDDLGVDARFGCCVFGRGNGTSALEIQNPMVCSSSRTFDGLNFSGTTATNGFTRNIADLSIALSSDGWGTFSGVANIYQAIQFSILSPRFHWRTNAKKIVFVITDGESTEGGQECQDPDSAFVYTKSLADTLSICNQDNVVVVAALNENGLTYSEINGLSATTGWPQDSYNVQGDLASENESRRTYDSIFIDLVATIKNAFLSDPAIIERDIGGYDPTFLKKASLLITYKGDLTDIWTQQKSLLRFDDNPPELSSATKGLTQFPSTIYTSKVCNIEPVHLIGNPDLWMYFDSSGSILYDYPSIGFTKSGFSDPILIAENATRPKVACNNRNNVFVAYESFRHRYPQIEIKGTGDFSQNSITGPKSSRLTSFISSSDFVFYQEITYPDEGVNQLCDLVVDKNDITHVTWQSNRDNYWEIYYANASNLFEPIRITRATSRSSNPTIEVDDTGSVYIVYHDNRFGPYEVLMSYKRVSRVVPLLQQDPYLASLASNYKHYTNILPIYVKNSGTLERQPGGIFCSKGNDNPYDPVDNYIFSVDYSGNPIRGGATEFNIVAMAGNTDGYLYGVTSDHKLLLLDSPDDAEDPYIDIETDEITEIGLIGLDNSSHVVDLAHDYDNASDGRLWALVIDTDPVNSSILTGVRIVQINKQTAEIQSQTSIFSNPSRISGGLSILPGNIFLIGVCLSSNWFLYRANYPTIVGQIATFDFHLVAENLIVQVDNVEQTAQIDAMTVDHDGTVYVLDDHNILSLNTEDYTFIFVSDIPDLSDGNDPYVGPFPIYEINGFAYHFSPETEVTGNDGYFNVIVEFYTNINREGSPYLTIDSREHLDSFLGLSSVGDEYIHSPKGVYLTVGESAFIHFDASLTRKGSNNLVYPYGFETNQTYFPLTTIVSENGTSIQLSEFQTVSFSCNKCSRTRSNIIDREACSYSFTVTNNSPARRYFNFQLDFYSDKERQFLLRRFELSPNKADLQYVEANNKPGEDVWTEFGLPINSNDTKLIQLYPSLDQQAGFLCGINYYCTVQECRNGIGEVCTDFIDVEGTTWDAYPIKSSPYQGTAVGMAVINDDLGLCWRDVQDGLVYAEFSTGQKEQIIPSDVGNIRIHEVNGAAAVAFIYQSTLRYAIRRAPNVWDINIVFGQGSFEHELTSDENGNPVIVYYNGTDVIFADNFDGSNWRNTNLGSTGGLFADLSVSVIDGVAYVHWLTYNLGKLVSKFAKRENGVWQTSGPSGLGLYGHRIVKVENTLFSICTNTSSDKLYWCSSTDGLSWSIGNVVLNNVQNLGLIKSSLEVIGGKPALVYVDKTSVTTYDLKVTRLLSELSENTWETTTVRESLTIQSSSNSRRVEISDYFGSTAIFNGQTPLQVYIDEAKEFVGSVPASFYCECSSTFLDDRVQSLSEMDRWFSSGQGYSDTRITDSPMDSIRPTISYKPRVNEIAIVFEDHNDPYGGQILGATFLNQDNQNAFGSGTGLRFDYDLNIGGIKPKSDSDLYGRTIIAYERPDPVSGKGVNPLIEIPSATVFIKACDFSALENNDQSQQIAVCNYDSIVGNVVLNDQFIAQSLIKKISVHPDFIQYFTLNSSGNATAVVKTCEIKLLLWFSPDVVAFRLKNENETAWSDWCPATPEISNYYTEKEWSISPSSGLKKICAEAITYNGITARFCVTVIADYEKVQFIIRMYSNVERTVELPLYEGIPVAFTAMDSDGVILDRKTIYIEIVPFAEVIEQSIRFDVLQQGINDQFDLIACKDKDKDGRDVFVGQFIIYREDRLFNIDGLAKIRCYLPGVCDKYLSIQTDCASESSKTSTTFFSADRYNLMAAETQSTSDVSDTLEQYRQDQTGKIGTSLVIRPNEDPYLIFGDPEFFLKG